jgi:hypothetical protein
MSEPTKPNAAGVAKMGKISEESARAQVLKLFDAFEVDLDVEADDGTINPDPFIEKLTSAARKGRLEVNGEGDEIIVTQHLHKAISGTKSLIWNWSRLGMGKARVKISSEGVLPFAQVYTTAAPMIGHDVTEIQQMHPLDLSLVEDIAGFFRKI